MKPSSRHATQAPTLREVARGSLRPAPPSFGFLSGHRRAPLSKQEMVAIIDEALRITSFDDMEDEDEDTLFLSPRQ